MINKYKLKEVTQRLYMYEQNLFLMNRLGEKKCPVTALDLSKTIRSTHSNTIAKLRCLEGQGLVKKAVNPKKPPKGPTPDLWEINKGLVEKIKLAVIRFADGNNKPGESKC